MFTKKYYVARSYNEEYMEDKVADMNFMYPDKHFEIEMGEETLVTYDGRVCKVYWMVEIRYLEDEDE